MNSVQLLPKICIATSRVECANCGLQAGCLPAGLNAHELAQLTSLIAPRYRVLRGDHLVRAGTDLQFLFAIRSGSMKGSILDTSGRQQITGFHHAGELLGMDAIGTGKHVCDVIAIEDSEVCKIPFSELQQLCRDIPALARNLNCMMSREIARSYRTMLLLASMSAEERLAAFLLRLSDRYLALGYSPSQLVLRMSRDEIGRYLGLKHETVSRTLSRFQRDALISVQGREIRLMDLEQLTAIMKGIDLQPGGSRTKKDGAVTMNRYPAMPPRHAATAVLLRQP
jgi:CRP/FNR family transcriptional regulator, anaerobic regulatory protein